MSWIKEFEELGGLNVLVRIQRESSSSSDVRRFPAEIQLEAVLCMRAFMNNMVGLKAVSRALSRSLSLSLVYSSVFPSIFRHTLANFQ